MTAIKVETLSQDAFSSFGSFYNPIENSTDLLEESGPILFYPDKMIAIFEHSNFVSLNSLILKPRDKYITVTEMHRHTEEVFGGFNQDVIFHVGLGGTTSPDISNFRVFLLPAGWWARVKRGVWHHAPYVVGEGYASGTVILPPCTYTHDCNVFNFDEPVEIIL